MSTGTPLKFKLVVAPLADEFDVLPPLYLFELGADTEHVVLGHEYLQVLLAVWVKVELAV